MSERYTMSGYQVIVLDNDTVEMRVDSVWKHFRNETEAHAYIKKQEEKARKLRAKNKT